MCYKNVDILCVFSVEVVLSFSYFFFFIWTSKLLQSISLEAEDLEWYNDPGHPQKEWSQDNFFI